MVNLRIGAGAHGMTMVELMVTIAIGLFLVTLAAPFTRGWADGNAVGEAAGKLRQAHGRAKAVALRNPQAAVAGAASAGLKLAGSALLVCSGDPAAAGCASGGANATYSADWPSGVSVSAGGAVLSSLSLDRDGSLTAGNTSFTVSRGSQSATVDLR